MIDLDELERLHTEAMAPPWVVDRIDDDTCCALDVITIGASTLAEADADPANPPIIAYLSHPDHAEGLACSEAEKLICAMRNALPELIRLARVGLATERNSRDLAQLHRVLNWLAKDDGVRRATLDYCEGEVRITLDTRGANGGLVAIGMASDFAGAVDIAESEGWDG